MSAKALILLVLGSLTANGMICACPGDAAGMDHHTTAHQHGKQQKAADCADDCDCPELESKKSDRSKAVRLEAPRLAADDDSGSIGTIDTRRSVQPQFSVPGAFLVVPTFQEPCSTPVSHKEQMLD